MSTVAFFCQLAAAETSIESYAQFIDHITDEEYKAALRTADLVDEALLWQSDLIDVQTVRTFGCTVDWHIPTVVKKSRQ